MSDEEPKCIAIDEETDHHIVHRCRFGKTCCATDKALDSGLQSDVLALNFLRLLLANGVLLWGDVPLVRPPAIRIYNRAKDLTPHRGPCTLSPCDDASRAHRRYRAGERRSPPAGEGKERGDGPVHGTV